MKIYKVLMYFTPTSDPHAPYYFLDKANIDPYLEKFQIFFPDMSYITEEEDYDSVAKIPTRPRDF